MHVDKAYGDLVREQRKAAERRRSERMVAEETARKTRALPPGTLAGDLDLWMGCDTATEFPIRDFS